MFAIRNFKYLGFCLGKNGKGIYIRVHAKSWKKAKDKLRKLTSRSRCGSIVKTMERIKVYMQGWLKYFSMADIKNNIESLNGWLYRRIRMCIWKQWKYPRTRMGKLMGLGVDSHYAATIAYDRKGYWFNAGNKAVNWALNKERLINWGYYDLATAYRLCTSTTETASYSILCYPREGFCAILDRVISQVIEICGGEKYAEEQH